MHGKLPGNGSLSSMSAGSRARWRAAFPIVCGVAITLTLLGTTEPRAQVLSTTGKWTPSPGPDWFHMQIHLALLPVTNGTYHSKILSWEYDDDGLPAGLWGWTPDTTVTSLNNCSSFPQANFTSIPVDNPVPVAGDLFCSGHTLLEDGNLLVSGGHDGGNDVGTRESVVFQRSGTPGAQWIRKGDMAQERWYPTNTTLPDGNVMSFSGSRYFPMIAFGGTSTPQLTSGAATANLEQMGLTTPGHWEATLTASPPWPEPREGHTAVRMPGQSLNGMMIFGGRRSGTATPLGDVWSLVVHPSATAYIYEWVNRTPAPGPLPPDPRMRHSAVEHEHALNDNRMIIYGGSNGQAHPSATSGSCAAMRRDSGCGPTSSRQALHRQRDSAISRCWTPS
jgi:hypothetical protein